MEALSECITKPTKAFQRIKEARDRLKKKLVECNDANAKIYKKIEELKTLASDIVEGNVKVSDLQKQLQQVVDEEVFESQPTASHNTICLTCKNCCHENCGLAEIGEGGSALFQSCCAFSNNVNCLVCTHSYTAHVHLKEKYVKTHKKVTMVDSNVQQAIQKAQNEFNSKGKTKNLIDAEIKKMRKEAADRHEEIHDIISDMRVVCARFDYLKEVDACINVLDEQIEVVVSDFSLSLDQNDAKKLEGLKKTKEEMTLLKENLIITLKKEDDDKYNKLKQDNKNTKKK